MRGLTEIISEISLPYPYEWGGVVTDAEMARIYIRHPHTKGRKRLLVIYVHNDLIGDPAFDLRRFVADQVSVVCTPRVP